MRSALTQPNEVEAVAAEASVTAARKLVHATDDQTLADMLELVQIPAPPFGEAARGQWVAARMRALGIPDVATDDEGNVLGLLPATEPDDEAPRDPSAAPDAEPSTNGGEDGRRPVIVAAHLDTVFPEGTDLSVRRVGDRLVAPGISDNARGLAALLAIARVTAATRPPISRPILFVATVGEEGAGDLRGVKHLFRTGSPYRSAAAFIALDGAGQRRIVHRALGAIRVRVTANGPGGHSWADAGRVNPVHVLGTAVAELAEISANVPSRSALTVARVGGGTSVNAIPESAWIEVDARAERGPDLERLEEQILRAVRGAVEKANLRRRRGSRAVTASVQVIGRRPSGETPPDSAVVRTAKAATRFIGEVPELAVSSTDANVPIALGIPAISLGAGGDSGGAHTTDEWYANRSGPAGIERVLLTVLTLAGAARRGS